MHWATRWRHSVLSATSSLTSSQVMSMFFRLRFTMSVQFIFARPGFLLYPFNSHCVAWWGTLESSIRMTCSNHLVFVLWLCLRVSSSPFSFWCHHFPAYSWVLAKRLLSGWLVGKSCLSRVSLSVRAKGRQARVCVPCAVRKHGRRGAISPSV